MPQTVNMTDKQHVGIGVTLLDVDGQAIASVPAGAITFVSDNPSVADAVVDATGLNADVPSGKVGSATITVSGTVGDKTLTDTVTVNVTNSVPGSLNLTVGTPVDE